LLQTTLYNYNKDKLNISAVMRMGCLYHADRQSLEPVAHRLRYVTSCYV